ncbi:MAG: proton-conducting transporter membrane subunit [Planctomycetaceae bacterium]
MTELHFPFLEAAVLVPLVGAAVVGRARDALRAHHLAIAFSALTLLAAIGAWQDFAVVHAGKSHPSVAHDRWDVLSQLVGDQILVVDELTAPLLPMIALLYFLTILTTQKTKVRRFGFGLALLSEAILLATFACREPWLVVALLSLGTIPPFFGLVARGRPARVYTLYMALFVILTVLGWTIVSTQGDGGPPPAWAFLPLAAAVLLRSGMIPFHSWMPDLFENATFGSALIFVAPITGAYAAIRLVVPIAPDAVLEGIAYVAVATAVYAAGMSLVQTDVRRYFSYLFLSHAALVLVGLEIITAVGLTGALCVWLSIGVAVAGLGLTLRALEARFGRLSLTRYHGLYEHTPALAICFVIAGLASVGFPGTLGFVGTEMLLDGAVETYPFVGVALLVAMCLNGISILRAYFLLFTGSRHASTVSLRVGWRERFAVVVLAGLLIGGGLYPQPGVVSRHEAAERIRRDRAALFDRSLERYADQLPQDAQSTHSDQSTHPRHPVTRTVTVADREER